MKYVAPKLPEGVDKSAGVILHVVVAQTGKPAKISVLSGDPALTPSAVRAVREWVFMPYEYKGEAVEMEGDLHIPFKATGSHRE
jgi:outer membrane biosynthesis protein TonB